MLGALFCLIFNAFVVLKLVYATHSNFIINQTINILQLTSVVVNFFANFIGTWVNLRNYHILHENVEFFTLGISWPTSRCNKIINKTYNLLIFFFVFLVIVIYSTYYSANKLSANVFSSAYVFNCLVLSQLYFYSQIIENCFKILSVNLLDKYKQNASKTARTEDSFLKFIERKYILLKRICINFEDIFKLQNLCITIVGFVVITIQLYYLFSIIVKTWDIINAVSVVALLAFKVGFLFYCHNKIIKQVSYVGYTKILLI